MKGVSKPVFEEQRCTATAKYTGERCRRWAVKGATVCVLHGAAAPAVRKAAARRVAQDKLTRKVQADVNAALAHEGLKAVTDPLEELGKLASEVVAFKDALGQRVQALRDIRYSAAGAGTEQLRTEVALLERAQDRVARILGLLISAGFEERRVARLERTDAVLEAFMRAVGLAGDQHAEEVLARLLADDEDRSLQQLGGQRAVRMSEDAGALVVRVIKDVAGALGLSPEQHAAVPPIAQAALRAVGSGDRFESPVPVPGAPRPDEDVAGAALTWLAASLGLPTGDARVQARVASARRALAAGEPLGEPAVPDDEDWWLTLAEVARLRVRSPQAAIGTAPAPGSVDEEGRRVLEGVVLGSFRKRPFGGAGS